MTNSANPSKNLARNLTPNWAKIAREVMIALPKTLTDMLNVVRFLRNDILGENTSSQKRQKLLYSFGPWEKLKSAVLDARLEPLPQEFTPKSEAELHAFCLKLLDRTGDFPLRKHFVEGWCGKLNALSALEEFSAKLWATRRNDPEFFDATVRGFHGTAARYIVRKRVPLGLTRDQAIDLIFRMALTWSAHDVQATTARALLVMTRPFGWLIFGSAKRMTAATVFSIWRRPYEILNLNFNWHRTNLEAQAGKPAGKPSRHDEVITIKAEVEPFLDRSLLLDVKRSERDAAVGTALKGVETIENGFWDELRNPTGRYDGMQMSEVWYHGLTPLQMIGLGVVRLIHAETVLRDRIEAVLEAEERGKPMPATELLPHSEQALPRGWEVRSRLLVDDLRRVILSDSDLHSRRPDDEKLEASAPSKNSDHIKAALQFIESAMKEPMPSDLNESDGKRNTLAKLSIATAVRFQR